jgi:hypothetical protein
MRLQVCSETPPQEDPQEVKRSIGEMRTLKISLQFTAFVMLLLFMACMPPTTEFSSIWKDETYQERPEKILVISAFKFPTNRRLFEEDFVKALKDRRIDAVVSYNVMPNPVVDDKNAIAVQAKTIGADTVLINRPLETAQKEIQISGGSLYGEAYIHTQTDVYDMKSNRLVFGATAETWLQKDKLYADQIQSYIKDLVNMMSRHKLF